MIALLNKKKFQFGFFAGVFFISLLVSAYTEQYYLIFIPFIILLTYQGWQYLNFLFFLLLFTLPFSFEYNFSPSLGLDLPDEPLMLMVSLLFFFYLLYASRAIDKNVLKHPVLLMLFVIMLWATVTVVFSTEKIVSIKYLLAKCWYVGAFVLAPLVVFRQKQNIRMASLLSAISMLLIAVIVLTKHGLHNFRFENISAAVSPFFRNHVNYSAMLVCMLPIFFAFYRLTPGKQKRLAVGLAIVILLGALFFSYARGAWLALAAGLISYWLIRKKYLLLTYIIVIGVLVGFLFWIKANDRYLQFSNDYKTTIFHKDFREHLVATYELKDLSTAERFYRWIAGVRMIKDRPLIGFGPNSFYYSYKSYALPGFKTWVSKNEEKSTVHNYFLLTAIEQGIPGLIFLLLLIGCLLYYAQHLYHRVYDLFYQTVSITIGVILTMILVVNFLSDLIETDKIGSLFFLCLSSLVVIDVSTKIKRESF